MKRLLFHLSLAVLMLTLTFGGVLALSKWANQSQMVRGSKEQALTRLMKALATTDKIGVKAICTSSAFAQFDELNQNKEFPNLCIYDSTPKGSRSNSWSVWKYWARNFSQNEVKRWLPSSHQGQFSPILPHRSEVGLNFMIVGGEWKVKKIIFGACR